MRIDVRNRRRERLFSVEVDAKHPPPVVKPSDGSGDVYLDWDQALDDQGTLRLCPVCGCRELFVRKDFPQLTGFWLVVLAALVAMILFGFRQVVLGLFVLGAVALLDAVIYLFTPRCLVCYRCRSEFRDAPIHPGQTGWELATGEKYHLDSEVDAVSKTPVGGHEEARRHEGT